MSWSASSGAVKYVLEASKDPAFPANGVVFRWEQETPSTDILITTVDRGTYSARVFAVDADGNYSMPSNVIAFSNHVHRADRRCADDRVADRRPDHVDAGDVHAGTTSSTRSRRVRAADRPRRRLLADRGRHPAAERAQLHGPDATDGRAEVLARPSFQGVINTAGTAAATAWSPVGTFTIADGPSGSAPSRCSRATSRAARNARRPAAEPGGAGFGRHRQALELEPPGRAAARVRRRPGLDLLRAVPLQDRAGERAGDRRR